MGMLSAELKEHWMEFLKGWKLAGLSVSHLAVLLVQ
jgi:hypothetical protein